MLRSRLTALLLAFSLVTPMLPAAAMCRSEAESVEDAHAAHGSNATALAATGEKRDGQGGEEQSPSQCIGFGYCAGAVLIEADSEAPPPSSRPAPVFVGVELTPPQPSLDLELRPPRI